MYFHLAQGTDCTGVRNCVCIDPEETGTHVFWTYFKQTAIGASWTFAPTLVPPSAKPSVSPVPTTSQTPSISHMPSPIPTPVPTNLPTNMPTELRCINLTLSMFDEYGDAWDEGDLKVYIGEDYYTYDPSIADCQDYYLQSSGTSCT